jgi:hypothetical protein
MIDCNIQCNNTCSVRIRIRIRNPQHDVNFGMRIHLGLKNRIFFGFRLEVCRVRVQFYSIVTCTYFLSRNSRRSERRMTSCAALDVFGHRRTTTTTTEKQSKTTT